jgi:hypothetical protein
MSYCYYTGEHLREMFDIVDKLGVDIVSETTIDSVYNDVADTVNHHADQ